VTATPSILPAVALRSMRVAALTADALIVSMPPSASAIVRRARSA
jgi:hypothetical protein